MPPPPVPSAGSPPGRAGTPPTTDSSPRAASPPPGSSPATRATRSQAAAEHCAGCGRPAAECPGCATPYDPPRFCRDCGRRLTVQVTPTGWRAHCRPCGATTHS